MKVYLHLGIPSPDKHGIGESLMECDGVTYDGDCIDGNMWYSCYRNLIVRPVVGDTICLSDAHQFIVTKILIFADDNQYEHSDDTMLTAECMCDIDYFING